MRRGRRQLEQLTHALVNQWFLDSVGTVGKFRCEYKGVTH